MRSGGDCAALRWCAGGGAGVRCILVNKKHYQSPKICVIFCKPRDHSPALCSALGTKICVACASKRSKEGDYFSVPPRCSSPLLAEETKGASSLFENIDFQPFFKDLILKAFLFLAKAPKLYTSFKFGTLKPLDSIVILQNQFSSTLVLSIVEFFLFRRKSDGFIY